MSPTLCPTATPRCSMLFEPDKTNQPFGFFTLENLLSARAGSMFPTNGAGPDEDVNVYLNHLLGQFLQGRTAPEVQFASGPLFNPPGQRKSCGQKSRYYRVNGDHRLLHLGLFDRGDGIRRSKGLFGMAAGEARQRDLSAARTCYEMAANLMRGRRGANPALAEVLEKLARNLEDYVHVLGALATRRLGLGAKFTQNNLARLLPTNDTESSRAVTDLINAPAPLAAFDALLDLWLAHGKNPAPQTASRLREMADRLGVVLDIP